MTILFFTGKRFEVSESFPYLQNKGIIFGKNAPLTSQEGIFGTFSINSNLDKPNVLVFYKNGYLEKGFHHPYAMRYPYSFQGFLDYIQEENEPFRIRVSGETCGTYNIDEYGKLTLDFITDPNLSYNSEFNLELLSLGLIKKIKKQDAKIKYDFLYR